MMVADALSDFVMAGLNITHHPITGKGFLALDKINS